MSNTVKKPEPSGSEGYSPKKPEILSMSQALCVETVLETVEIGGVRFDILQKSRTLYAGFHAVAPDNRSEPGGTYEAFMAGMGRIADSATPDCMIAVSIGYALWDKTYPLEFLHGQETTNPRQPEGVYVLDAPPTLFIRTRSSDEAWRLTKKLTGEDNPGWHMAPLFGLIRRIFCDGAYGYEYSANGNHEMEYYYADRALVYVPVKKK